MLCSTWKEIIFGSSQHFGVLSGLPETNRNPVFPHQPNLNMLGIKKCSLGRSSTKCQQTEIIFLIFSGHATVNRRFSHSLLELFHCVSWNKMNKQAMDSNPEETAGKGDHFWHRHVEKLGDWHPQIAITIQVEKWSKNILGKRSSTIETGNVPFSANHWNWWFCCSINRMHRTKFATLHGKVLGIHP